MASYAEHVRARRQILGLSQRELARRAGVTQPLVSAIEAGAKKPSAAIRDAFDRELAIRPSQALAARRGEVQALFVRARLPAPRVFGSVARGEDSADSDLDLIVAFEDHHDIVDLLALEEDLEALLTVPVDIVDARAHGTVTDQAAREAVAL